MTTHVWMLVVSGAVAITAIALAAFAVSKMEKGSPARVAIVIAALAGFIAAIPPLVASFTALQA
ncbi:hypothetical protein AB0937_31215 [Streptomyces sp. NPDC047880]|uniref:hypothetical protein n=1 Tax=Streptomyces sp. NPDC047880 TaxID=3155626 RepID=UPI00345708E5